VAFGWYLNKGISTSINYHNLNQEFDTWKPSWALVTGRNKTYPGISSVGPFLPFFTDDPFYCALLTYETVDGGTTVTATSMTNCGHLPAEVVIGEEMEIMYNPDNMQEVLEKDIVDESLGALVGAMIIVFIFALGFLCCTVLLWKRRDVPIGLERHAHSRRAVPMRRRVQDDDEVDIELAPEEVQRRRRERVEKIVKHFHYKTVSKEGEEHDASSFIPSLSKSTLSECGSEMTERSTSTDEASLPPPQDSQSDECCICMEKYSRGDHICTPTTADDCKHIFHAGCIFAWLQHHDHCPLCRVNLVQDHHQ